MRKVIITVSLTGGIQTKAANPNLPEQPSEIAQAAYECLNEGAAIAHLHARDKEGKPTTVMEESNDINELTGALYYITRQMEQKYGKPEMQAEQPKTLDRNSAEFRADRVRIIQLLRAGRKEDAFLLMRKWQYNDEEALQIRREASKRGVLSQYSRGALGYGGGFGRR